ncbi:MAG: 3-phosphoshikimate 1-carboxyvinyltransferase [Endomicrobium sp.]|jgi:3-phosphoshikimate 1-carboxyvinyltransferase|nr:3-phosphoshikimate 1-carboxyvinyltransferase [Endomicrobium sp.]
MDFKLRKVNALSGTIEIPADKSITHRAIMLASIASGKSIIRNYLNSDDCNRTIEVFRQMGAEIKVEKKDLYITGVGLNIPQPKRDRYEFYAGNSGTTSRLLSGILSGQNFKSVITGDQSLSKRPMSGVVIPLLQMGANIFLNKGSLPMEITGSLCLKSVNYVSDKANAQVKSAVLLAGLYAGGSTTYLEPIKSRDHTERMLKLFGINVEVNGNSVTINPIKKLLPQEIFVPGDMSSAAFFIAAALIIPGSNLTIKNIGINPTRDGLIEVLKQMGADITLTNLREISNEPICDITVKYSKLSSININADIIPRMIDEIPIFVLVATQAEGITRISGTKELRVKESDRISAIASQFKKLGAQVEALEDGFIVNGSSNVFLTGTLLDSFEDHRVAMTLAIASLIAKGETIIRDSSCVNISFPGFYEVLKSICK